MAHELKNPLTPIQLIFSSVQRAYRGDDDNYKEKLEKSYEMLQSEISGLRRLVDSFTKFSSLPVAKLDRADIIKTAKNVVQKYQSFDHDHEILFVNETSQDTIYWNHDVGLFSQVLANLIKNSIEASHLSPSQIILSLFSDETNITIEVLDNGPGIPKDIQHNIFDPHFTTKEKESHAGLTKDFGMGLGLSVCQKIIYDHGGEITFKSVPNSTSFKVTIPL